MKPTGAIHPAAAAWPTLPDDELAALAASIAAIGLLEPIVLTPAGEVLDGRNRLAACDLAGVAPSFVTYDGDPVAFVLARNEHRRHITKGQRAMASWLTAATDGNSVTKRGVAAAAGLNDAHVGMAKVVAQSAPDLVALVLAGTRPLKDAYDEARRRRDAARIVVTPVVADADDFEEWEADLVDAARAFPLAEIIGSWTKLGEDLPGIRARFPEYIATGKTTAATFDEWLHQQEGWPEHIAWAELLGLRPSPETVIEALGNAPCDLATLAACRRGEDLTGVHAVARQAIMLLQAPTWVPLVMASRARQP